MKYELVSPERMLASGDTTQVTLPGQNGELTAMDNHAAFLTTLRPGFVTIGDGEDRYFVTGGFAEISDNVVSILAEEAVEASAVTANYLSEKIAAAERLTEEAAAERKIIESQKLYDYRAIAAQLPG